MGPRNHHKVNLRGLLIRRFDQEPHNRDGVCLDQLWELWGRSPEDRGEPLRSPQCHLQSPEGGPLKWLGLHQSKRSHFNPQVWPRTSQQRRSRSGSTLRTLRVVTWESGWTPSGPSMSPPPVTRRGTSLVGQVQTSQLSNIVWKFIVKVWLLFAPYV